MSDLPDPRRARGRRHHRGTILTLIAAALASGQQGMPAISQWVAEHAEELCALPQPPRGRLPSDSTLRRALRALDLAALEQRVAAYVEGLAAPPEDGAAVVGLAVDGKAVRGATAHGAAVQEGGPLWKHRDGVEGEALYVERDWRGTGLAAALLAAALTWART